MKIKLGQKITIDGIRMVCTLVKVRFRGESYCFTYFINGELKEYEFDGNELEALGAKEDKES